MIRLAVDLGSLNEAIEQEIDVGALKIDCLSKTIYFCISDSFIISLDMIKYEEKILFEAILIKSLKHVWIFFCILCQRKQQCRVILRGYM